MYPRRSRWAPMEHMHTNTPVQSTHNDQVRPQVQQYTQDVSLALSELAALLIEEIPPPRVPMLVLVLQLLLLLLLLMLLEKREVSTHWISRPVDQIHDQTKARYPFLSNLHGHHAMAASCV